jgi:A/G-specific adenine glycosylase
VAEQGLDRNGVEALLQWFQRNARDLPWRHDRSPYRVWVSEIMLQQTQVDTVIPYFQRFMQEFPDLDRLAEAHEDRLMALWAGLGYYSRARNLQKAARQIVAEYGGRFPEDPALVRGLPGFGDYTTAAVLSLSRGQDLAVLDGNVARVLARVFTVEGDPRTGPVRRRLQALADGGMPAGRAGEYNEALMELGATVCRPRPLCESCPLAGSCQARASGRQQEFPARGPRPARPCFASVVLVAPIGGGRILLHRRPGKGLLGGLWELPAQRGQQELDANRAPDSIVRPLLCELLDTLPARAGKGAARALPVFRHHYSHFSVELHPHEQELLPHTLPAEWRAVDPATRDGLGVSASDRRILDSWAGGDL